MLCFYICGLFQTLPHTNNYTKNKQTDKATDTYRKPKDRDNLAKITTVTLEQVATLSLNGTWRIKNETYSIFTLHTDNGFLSFLIADQSCFHFCQL